MGDLTEHFDYSEFVCHCCGKGLVSMGLVLPLEDLRTHIGKPVHISSSCRCQAHNKRVGGAKNSYHLFDEETEKETKAADIWVAGMSLETLYFHATKIRTFNEGGIGIYPDQGFIHVDIRPTRARWGKLMEEFTTLTAALEETKKGVS